MKVIVLLLLSLMLAGCNFPGYTAHPHEFRFGMPYFLGGPSMTWRFEEDE